MKSVNWHDYTSAELKDLISSGRTTAILPMGATEQHGPHLGVFYDSAIAIKIAEDLARKNKNSLVLPAIHVGASDHHFGFPGTLSLSAKTIMAMLTELVESLKKSGIKKVFIVNGHGGNYGVIADFVKNCKIKGVKVYSDAAEKFIFKAIHDHSHDHSGPELGLHAGLFETSLALYTHPNAVRVNKIVQGAAPKNKVAWSQEEMQRLFKYGLKAVTKNGVIGLPKGSNKKLGQVFYKSLLKSYQDLYKQKI